MGSCRVCALAITITFKVAMPLSGVSFGSLSQGGISNDYRDGAKSIEKRKSIEQSIEKV